MKNRKKREEIFSEESFRESLREGLKYLRGEKSKVKVSTLFIPLGAGDVKAARKVLNVTQTQFAKLIRVSPETVRKWEQGKNPIEGPAGILIKGLIQQPDVFGSILHQA